MPKYVQGLSKAKVRELARTYVGAIRSADCLEALPGDEWLNARARELGCPEAELETVRAAIRSTPLHELADGHC
jgi:hypothetical protein